MPLILRNAFGYELGVFSPVPGEAINGVINATPTLIVIPAGSLVVALYSTVGYYAKLGDDTVVVSVSNCHRYPKSISIFAVSGYTHLSVIRAEGVDGILNVGRLKW